MYFLLNLSLCVKSYGHLCQILAFFCHAHSPNMVMSRDPSFTFRNFYFCPNSIFNIRKRHKVFVEKFSASEVINQKPCRGGGGGDGKHILHTVKKG